MDVLLWAIGILVSLQTGALSFLGVSVWKLASSVAAFGSRIDRVEQDIGTRETGIRGAIHSQGNKFSELEVRIRALEARI